MGPVGVIGLGMVGGTISRVFREAGVVVHDYDRYLEIGRPEELRNCGVVFLCVPTPSLPNNGYDLTEIWSAASEIEDILEPGSIVAVKSTVPPGTNDRLAEAFPKLEFASLPEFLVASRSVETLTHPDRVIIGTRSGEVAAVLTGLMAQVAPEAPVIQLTPMEAEFAKLCANALLSAKVAMANELSDLCARYDVSWPRVKAVVGLDRRIGPDHLTVTEERGFGGACLPKDLDGLIGVAEAVGWSSTLLREIADFNRRIRGETGKGTRSRRFVASSGDEMRSSHSNNGRVSEIRAREA
jgi:nucleotide sugar dehydrogenase